MLRTIQLSKYGTGGACAWGHDEKTPDKQSPVYRVVGKSKYAVAFRGWAMHAQPDVKEEGIDLLDHLSGRNVATFKLVPKGASKGAKHRGEAKYVTMGSAGLEKHSESLIIEALHAKTIGVDLAAYEVVWVYTELSPCVNCTPKLEKFLNQHGRDGKDTPVYFHFIWPDGVAEAKKAKGQLISTKLHSPLFLFSKKENAQLHERIVDGLREGQRLWVHHLAGCEPDYLDLVDTEDGYSSDSSTSSSYSMDSD